MAAANAAAAIELSKRLSKGFFELKGPASGATDNAAAGAINGMPLSPGRLHSISCPLIDQSATDATVIYSGSILVELAIQPNDVGLTSWTPLSHSWEERDYTYSGHSANFFPDLNVDQNDFLVGRIWHRDALAGAPRSVRVYPRLVA